MAQENRNPPRALGIEKEAAKNGVRSEWAWLAVFGIGSERNGNECGKKVKLE